MTRAKSCLLTVLLFLILGLPFIFTREVAVEWFNDYKEIRKFHAIKEKAESGDIYAQAQLGGRYIKGLGVGRDQAEGGLWLRRSTRSGIISGQEWLGHFYFDAVVASRGIDDAARWYGMSADQGHEEALLYLALCHKAAGDVSGSYIEAYAYFLSYSSYAGGGKFSTLRWPPGAREDLGGLAKLMTASELALASRRSIEIQASFEPKYLARKRQEAEKIQAEYDKLMKEKSSGK
jgi:TPR repeat protein